MDTNGIPSGFQGFASAPVEPPVSQPQQPITIQQSTPQAQPVANKGTVLLSDEQVDQYINQLKPMIMSNPVKIVEPSYVVTERQMQYLLSLAQGNPNSAFLNAQPQGFAQGIKQQIQQMLPQQYGVQPQKPKNVLDDLGNLTFGTAGRIGHTLTSVVDGVIDILTFGYASRR